MIDRLVPSSVLFLIRCKGVRIICAGDLPNVPSPFQRASPLFKALSF